MTKTKAQQIMAATEVRAADDVTAAIQDIAAEFEPYIIKQRRHFHRRENPIRRRLVANIVHLDTNRHHVIEQLRQLGVAIPKKIGG